MMRIAIKAALLIMGIFCMSIAFDKEIISPRAKSTADRTVIQGMLKLIASILLGIGLAL